MIGKRHIPYVEKLWEFFGTGEEFPFFIVPARKIRNPLQSE